MGWQERLEEWAWVPGSIAFLVAFSAFGLPLVALALPWPANFALDARGVRRGWCYRAAERRRRDPTSGPTSPAANAAG
jgi:hypothetical protein